MKSSDFSGVNNNGSASDIHGAASPDGDSGEHGEGCVSTWESAWIDLGGEG